MRSRLARSGNQRVQAAAISMEPTPPNTTEPTAPKAAAVTPEALEVRPFRPEAIPWPELAFRTTEWALRDWVRRVRPDLEAGGR